MSELTDFIFDVYKMTNAEIADTSEAIFDGRTRAWVKSIEAELRRLGCTQKAKAPSGADLSSLRRQSRQDAESIAATYNRDLRRIVETLYAANPRGNQRYYTSNLDIWARERESWKSRQIALNTEQTASYSARVQFRKVNNVTGGRYIYDGPAPVGPICVRRFGMGVVTWSVVQNEETPAHPNCPHSWKEIEAPKRVATCEELWVG